MDDAANDIVVRDARRDDFEPIRSVIAAANEEFRPLVPGAFFRAYLASALDVEGRLDGGVPIVIERGGQIVGSVTFFRDAHDEGMGPSFPSRTAGLRATAVHPMFRGAGLGSRLVAECIARSRAVGAAQLALHTAEFMRGAIAMYERAGFRRAPEFDFLATDFFRTDAQGEIVAIGYVLAVP